MDNTRYKDLRDEFAMAAMRGAVSSPEAMQLINYEEATPVLPVTAKWCYEMADAMMKAREDN